MQHGPSHRKSVLEAPFGGLGQRTMFILGSLESSWAT